MYEYGPRQDGSDVSNVSEDELRALWQQAFAEHLPPSRLFRLAMGLATQLPEDAQHLAACSQCRSVYQRYRSDRTVLNHAHPEKDVPGDSIGNCTAGANETGGANGNRKQPALSLFGT